MVQGSEGKTYHGLCLRTVCSFGLKHGDWGEDLVKGHMAGRPPVSTDYFILTIGLSLVNEEVDPEGQAHEAI
jgi:hypothetical protein